MEIGYVRWLTGEPFVSGVLHIAIPWPRRAAAPASILSEERQRPAVHGETLFLKESCAPVCPGGGHSRQEATVIVQTRLVAALVSLLAAMTACRGDVANEQTWSDDDRTFYALGTVVARRVKHFAPSPAELAIAKRAIADSVRGLPSPVSLDAEQEGVQKLAELRLPMVAAATRADGERALARAAREPAAVTTPTGVVRRSLSPGSGALPGLNDKVRVRHEGRLTSGALITSRKPVVVDIATSIPCLKQTLLTMKVGEKVRITCPAAQAFGEAGAPPRIPENAVIVSTLELLEILAPGAAAATAVAAGGAP